MADKFDIIEYLSGLTPFVFDKALLKRIALDRGVDMINLYSRLTQEQKELLRADLLYAAYLSPTTWASSTQSHGSFSQSVGGQNVSTIDKDLLYNAFIAVYKKYNDSKLEEIDEIGNLQWV